ncbi:VOC family protein [Patescibacteria group bacterium]|nr:VOC family protein [Patescibacteria group bacterium]
MYSKTLDGFHEDATPYIEMFNTFASKHDLVGKTAPDHLCFKCGSKESFEAMRAMFEQESQYMHQAIISGRRIAYIKLKQPIHTVLGEIWFIELSDQKTDNSQVDSYDHIEVYGTQMSYDEMVAHLQESGANVVKVERPHHTTHNVDIGGFTFSCTRGPLVEKIKSEEM